MKKTLFVTLVVLLLAYVVVAQTRATGRATAVHKNAGTSCGSDPILPTDGSATDDFVANGAPNWYLVHLKGGHSYSVEVYDSIDPVIGGMAALGLIATDCTTPITTTDVTKVDPDLSATFGARMSFIQAADGDAYVNLTTTDTNGNAYTIRVTDTTLVNPRWTTIGGFETQYALVNNTSVQLTGTLTFYNTSGTVVTSTPGITLPPLGENFQIIATPKQQFGFATFAFVGPAGAVTADAYFINGNATVVVPSTLAPRNYQH